MAAASQTPSGWALGSSIARLADAVSAQTTIGVGERPAYTSGGWFGHPTNLWRCNGECGRG